MTAITYGNSSGETRRCDAKCHNAKNADCDCICAGVLHGAGSKTAELGLRISKLIDEMFGVHVDLEQQELFTDPERGCGT